MARVVCDGNGAGCYREKGGMNFWYIMPLYKYSLLTLLWVLLLTPRVLVWLWLKHMTFAQYNNVPPNDPTSWMVSVVACFEIYLCFFNLTGIALFSHSRTHPQGLIIATLLTNIQRNLTTFITTDSFWLGTAGIYCKWRISYAKWTQL